MTTRFTHALLRLCTITAVACCTAACNRRAKARHDSPPQTPRAAHTTAEAVNTSHGRIVRTPPCTVPHLSLTHDMPVDAVRVSNRVLSLMNTMTDVTARERVLTPLLGLPDSLSADERAARMAAFDTFNNRSLFPEPMDDWCILSPEYRDIHSPLLSPEEIQSLIAARGNDWLGLVQDAGSLMQGIETYKDIHAARALYEYIYAHCPEDVNTDGEFHKYDALFYLAWSYFNGDVTDEPERAIHYYNELLENFSGDFRAGDPAMAYKEIYFTHPLYHLYSAYMAAGQTAAAHDALARLQAGLAPMGADADAAFAMCRLRGELRADVFAATAAGCHPAQLESRFALQEQRLQELLASPHMTPHTRAKTEYDLAETRKALTYIRQRK